MNRSTIEDLESQGGLDTVYSGAHDDIYICCVSYEARTLSVINCLSSNYRSKRGVIYINKEFLRGYGAEPTRSNLGKIRTILENHCDSTEVATGSWLEAKEQLISLREALVPKDPQKGQHLRITIDTSTFTRESLLTTMLLLRTHFPTSDIRILYVSPHEHGKWLSRGFREIRNVMGFSGVQHTTRPTVLLVLSGFEPERTFKIIDEHEPNKVLLGLGDPPTRAEFLERNKNEQKVILARQDVEEFRFPADDIGACWKCLEIVVEPYLRDHNIVIAPMSTKLSTISTFLIAQCHSDIQITYCLPGEYNVHDYSKGPYVLFIDSVPYGDSD